jgi:hypothetical protein
MQRKDQAIGQLLLVQKVRVCSDLFNITVSYVDEIGTLPQMAGKLFYEKDRTMVTASTTDRYGQIGATLLLTERCDEVEQALEAIEVGLSRRRSQ